MAQEAQQDIPYDKKFDLVWKEGTTVVNTIEVPRKQVPFGENEYTFEPTNDPAAATSDPIRTAAVAGGSTAFLCQVPTISG